ncbi:uncharacterized protein [Procambarus clarkii]|uniref:uncharacterized protein n=1 Tax=Procambarus clarkii TaxID=6728 RepID=UPI00374472BA
MTYFLQTRQNGLQLSTDSNGVAHQPPPRTDVYIQRSSSFNYLGVPLALRSPTAKRDLLSSRVKRNFRAKMCAWFEALPFIVLGAKELIEAWNRTTTNAEERHQFREARVLRH